MANDFAGDSACVAHWRFESDPGFLVDSIGTNTLTNNGADVETSTVFEGSQAAAFVDANSDYMVIADADQDPGFPFRYADGGSMEHSFTKCFRVYLNTLPSVTGSMGLIQKWNDPTAAYYELSVRSTNYFRFRAFYASSPFNEDITYGTVMQAGRWYSIGVTYNNSDYSIRIRIYDHTAGAFLDSDTIGNFTYPLGYGYTGQAPFELSNPDDPAYLDGILDDIVIFNDVKTVSEIDLIRKQLYPAASFCWGHDTSVNEDVVGNFSDWTGTGAVAGTGDAEALCLASGQSKTSPIENTGVGTFKITYDNYNTGSGSAGTIEYRTADTEAGVSSAQWNTYNGVSFDSLGYAQTRFSVS